MLSRCFRLDTEEKHWQCKSNGRQHASTKETPEYINWTSSGTNLDIANNDVLQPASDKIINQSTRQIYPRVDNYIEKWETPVHMLQALRSIPLHCNTVNYITNMAWHDTTLHIWQTSHTIINTLHALSLSLSRSLFQAWVSYIHACKHTLHTLHVITLHYITSQHIALENLTVHYTTSTWHLCLFPFMHIRIPNRTAADHEMPDHTSPPRLLSQYCNYICIHASSYFTLPE